MDPHAYTSVETAVAPLPTFAERWELRRRITLYLSAILVGLLLGTGADSIHRSGPAPQPTLTASATPQAADTSGATVAAPAAAATDATELAPEPAPQPVAAVVPTPAKGVVYRSVGGVDLTFDYLPAVGVTGPAPVVILLHGGGWWRGSKADLTSDADVAHKLTTAGFAVVSADYRLACGTAAAPRSAFGFQYATGSPLCGAHVADQTSDIHALIRNVRERSTTFGVDPQRVGVLGASAGGHLALLAAVTAPEGEHVQAVVNWSGAPSVEFISRQSPHPTRGERNIRASFANVVGCDIDACPGRWLAASPLNFLDSAPRETAVLGVAGSSESQVPISAIRGFHQRLQRLGMRSQVLTGSDACHGTACSETIMSENGRSGLSGTIGFLRREL